MANDYGCACRWVADKGQTVECATHAALRAEVDSLKAQGGNELLVRAETAERDKRLESLAHPTASSVLDAAADGEQYRADIRSLIADYRKAMAEVDRLAEALASVEDNA